MEHKRMGFFDFLGRKQGTFVEGRKEKEHKTKSSGHEEKDAALYAAKVTYKDDVNVKEIRVSERSHTPPEGNITDMEGIDTSSNNNF